MQTTLAIAQGALIRSTKTDAQQTRNAAAAKQGTASPALDATDFNVDMM
ncbi:hypothetical protein [Celeribacter sp.]